MATLMLHHKAVEHSQRKVWSALVRTPAHRIPKLPCVTVIDRRKTGISSHQTFALFAPGHGWLRHCRDSNSRCPDDVAPTGALVYIPVCSGSIVNMK